MKLCCADLARYGSELDNIQNSLQTYISRGNLLTVNDIVDYIYAESGNSIPESCHWLVVDLSLVLLRQVQLPSL
ncbi:MAG TPA: hypothetical protein VH164_03070 [Ktedonobacteraceae bacterium]|jgi:hypothetical protein|nr:hypothetical protein [Ktedonobacteraceae bacterium]